MPVWFRILFFLMAPFFVLTGVAQVDGQTKAILKITFIHTINNVPVVLDSTNYTNCRNEIFTLNKLKYYISNIRLQTADKKMIREENSYHLINEEDTASKSFSFFMPPNNYTSLHF